MTTQEAISALRKKHQLTQQQFADKLFVTRQAVSRWETGETTPGPDTLKLISKTFDVSINTLMGSPRRLFCQCCGMPLDDDSISREPDGSFNEDYCKWCYTDGRFIYHSLDELVDFLVHHIPFGDKPIDEVKQFLTSQLSQLDYWRKEKAPR